MSSNQHLGIGKNKNKKTTEQQIEKSLSINKKPKNRNGPKGEKNEMRVD